MNEDLKQIKKKYGEAMSHLCRKLFPTLLEKEGLLPKILLEHFNENHTLCEDIVKNDLIKDFKNYIYSLVETKDNKKGKEIKTPEELLDVAGYNLYECKTEEDIQSFKKYYTKDEELCTFRGERLKYCRVFFAVKKNVDEIRREDFPNPKRQDLYGTSVISIQFDKDETNRLSIKNRYNHTVSNSDSTFSNNLDNIIGGLTDSFEKHYGIIQRYKNKQFEIPNYVLASNGKFYKCNYELYDTYYCPNNIVINSDGIKQYDKEKYLVFDYFILDLVNKKIKCNAHFSETFVNCIGTIQKIEIKNKKEEKEEKEIIITNTENHSTTLTLDKENRLIGFSNAFLKEINCDFLVFNKTLKKLELENLEKIDNFFLDRNTSLTSIYLPKVEEIGNFFLRMNNTLTTINLPNVKKIGTHFLNRNENILQINLPKVKEVGTYFLYRNKNLKAVNFPDLQEVSHSFLKENNSLLYLNLPNVKKIGNDFLSYNHTLTKINLPNVLQIGNDFLFDNEKLVEVTLPNIEQIGSDFLFSNRNLTNLVFPNLQKVGNRFLVENQMIRNFYAPNLQSSEQFLLHHPNRLYIIQMLKLQKKSNKVKQLIKKIKF